MRTFPHIIVLAAFGCALLGAGCYAEDAAPAASADAVPSKSQPIHAVPDSLMFTSDEINEIQSHASGSDASGGGPVQAIEDATLYLSSILYTAPNDWTIWVNGVPIGPNQDFQAFQVTEINPSSVELLVPLSAQGMRPVKLQPNQTFLTKSGTVVEGKYP